MKRVALIAAAVVAAAVVWTAVAEPPRSIRLDASWQDGSVSGLLHVHTSRSDGRSSPEEIAAIAARAGLRFLVFTDHGDATREPDPPTYRSGVLCLDAVEISTTGGHYIAVGMGRAPYPLGGESRDVVEDVRRLGGFGIAAHPDSPKESLAWADWDAPIDSLELMNLDTSWRMHVAGGWRSRLRLFGALFTYPFRSGETIASLITGGDLLRSRWSALGRDRSIVGLAGADAHARLELREESPGVTPLALPFPGYEPSFRAMSVHVAPTSALDGDAALDAARLLGGIRQGHVYTTVDAWAARPAFEFTARNGATTASAGDVLNAGRPLTFSVRSNAPASYRTQLWHDESLVADEPGDRSLTIANAGVSGVYRVEIRADRHRGGPPWLTSNPIYVRDAEALRATQAERRVAREGLTLFDGHSTAGWSQEKDPTSLAAIEAVQMVTGTELRMRFGLAGGARTGQFAGAIVETRSGVGAYDALAFTARAEKPMRMSVQVRAATAADDAATERWQRSVVLGPDAAEQLVAFDDMRPIGRTHAARVTGADIRTVLFVVDTTNSAPGTSGRIWFKDVRLVRRGR